MRQRLASNVDNDSLQMSRTPRAGLVLEPHSPYAQQRMSVQHIPLPTSPAAHTSQFALTAESLYAESPCADSPGAESPGGCESALTTSPPSSAPTLSGYTNPHAHGEERADASDTSVINGTDGESRRETALTKPSQLTHESAAPAAAAEEASETEEAAATAAEDAAASVAAAAGAAGGAGQGMGERSSAAWDAQQVLTPQPLQQQQQRKQQPERALTAAEQLQALAVAEWGSTPPPGGESFITSTGMSSYAKFTDDPTHRADMPLASQAVPNPPALTMVSKLYACCVNKPGR